jgi:hypothetical protein
MSRITLNKSTDILLDTALVEVDKLVNNLNDLKNVNNVIGLFSTLQKAKVNVEVIKNIVQIVENNVD